MKTYIKTLLVMVIPILITGMIFTACEDDELANGGEPVIRYIRVTNPDASDSLVAQAFLGNLIAIMGENLGSVRELWFNDREANLIPTYITNTTIIVNVPSQAPLETSDKMRLVFKNGSELLYDFVVRIPPPVIASMDLEYVADGETAVINGDYFFDVTPIVVEFPADGGGFIEAEITSTDENKLEVIVPDGSGTGPIRITTNFGTSESVLHFRDQRNIILNYDDLTAAGSWRPGPTEAIDPLDGNYLKLFGTYDANQRNEDNFESQFWGHTRYPVEQNLFEGFPEDHVLKFEARVPEWSESYLQICWGPWSNNNNGEVWGNLNGRGLWAPWLETGGTFTTNDKWITVAIELMDMKYSHNQDDGNNTWVENMPFNKNVAGTLSFWVIASPDADGSPVEIHIDNVRIVPNKEL